jgi:hypothetical protein
LFHTFRAAEILVLNGHAFDGYAILRNAKEQALCLGAVANGLSSIPNWFGHKGLPEAEWTREQYEQTLKSREVEERRIRQGMIGKQSGLGAEQIAELQKWDRMFNLQVHGARLTQYKAADALRDKSKPFVLAPQPHVDEDAVYMNRFSEVAWMSNRCLLFLQLKELPFADDWLRRWQIMDESIRYMVLGLDSLGKKIAKAFESMIDTKFPFNRETVYIERE